MFNVDFYEDLAWGKPNIDVDNESFIKVDAYIYIYTYLKKKIVIFHIYVKYPPC